MAHIGLMGFFSSKRERHLWAWTAALVVAIYATLGVISLVMFVATLLALPVIVAYLPQNYFVRPRRARREIGPTNWVWLVGKNFIGVTLIVAGVAMLLLPGQGLLTILVGLMLTNFPGKRTLERWIVGRPRVLASLNWLRKKCDRPPLLIHCEKQGEESAGKP